jgi:hypothetical protein
MPQKFRPITKTEKAQQIGIGLFIAFIFASSIGFIAPFIFQWVVGVFDPNPKVPPDCNILEFMKAERALAEYQTCEAQAKDFASRAERISDKIPWVWITFIFFSWVFCRNALKGRIRDNSEDISYPGQGAWDILACIWGTLLFYVLIWVIGARDRASFIGLGIWVLVVFVSIFIHRWLLQKYGKTKAERDTL